VLGHEVPVSRIKNKAANYDIKVKTKKVDGEDVVVFPEEKRELKRLLEFLCERLHEGDLTGTKYLINSHKTLPG